MYFNDQAIEEGSLDEVEEKQKTKTRSKKRKKDEDGEPSGESRSSKVTKHDNVLIESNVTELQVYQNQNIFHIYLYDFKITFCLYQWGP